MAVRHLLGIDFGTGGAKACVLDDQGKVLGYAYREYPIIHPHPGWSEHDPETYWRVTCEIVAEALRAADCLPQEIAGIGVSSALPSMVLLDEAGAALAPATNLMDRRATAEVETIRDLLGESTIEQVTANRIEDHPSLVNLYWYQQHRRSVFDRVATALTIDGYVVSRLTGRRTLNRSSAVFYGVAFDIRQGRFREELLDKLGLDPGLLPELFDPTDVVGEVTSAAAEVTGLAAGTPVVAGQVDCNAGWLAGGAVEPGDVQLNLGTSGVLGVVHRDPEFLTSPAGLRMVNIPYTTSPSDTWTAVAVTTTGGQALRFIRDTFAPGEVDVARQLHVNSYDLITLQANDIPPGSEGLVVLPYLMGERSPIWDTAARGVLFGLSLHHHRGHVFRAFLEGVAYALRDSLELLQASGLPMNGPLVFNEGGAKSHLWRRIITDVFGIPTALLKERTGAPRGDALLAGVGAGVFSDFSIARQWATLTEHLEPDLATHRIYSEYFDLYRNLYSALRLPFRELKDVVRATTD